MRPSRLDASRTSTDGFRLTDRDRPPSPKLMFTLSPGASVRRLSALKPHHGLNARSCRSSGPPLVHRSQTVSPSPLSVNPPRRFQLLCSVALAFVLIARSIICPDVVQCCQ